MTNFRIQTSLLILFIIPFQLIKSQDFCDFFQKVQKYQSSVNLQHIANEYDRLDTATFNLSTYLKFFDHLHVSKNMKIGIYYIDNELDGNPYLYAIRKNQKLEKVVGIPTEKMLKKKNAKYSSDEYVALYYFLKDSSARAKNNIIPEDSEFGFLQYLFFSDMGERFALKWHSAKQNKSIICSSEMISQLVEEQAKYGNYSDDSASWVNFKNCNPEPKISSDEKSYEITWIENWPDFGVFKRTYQIERESPFRIIIIKEEKLLDINTNVINLY
jgi:hypothetical protein